MRYLVCIGAMKAGTTSLHYWLAAHPDLQLPRAKELDYFSHGRGESLAAYEKLFGTTTRQVRADVSPSYAATLADDGTAHRLVSTLPADTLLVYLLRDPVERMRSHYVHEVLRSRETRPASAALDDARYLAPSCYADQLSRYVSAGAADRTVLVTSDAFWANPRQVTAALVALVGLDPERLTEPSSGADYRSEDRVALTPRSEALRTSRLGRAARSLMGPRAKSVAQSALRLVPGMTSNRTAETIIATAAHWQPSERTAERLAKQLDALGQLAHQCHMVIDPDGIGGLARLGASLPT